MWIFNNIANDTATKCELVMARFKRCSRIVALANCRRCMVLCSCSVRLIFDSHCVIRTKSIIEFYSLSRNSHRAHPSRLHCGLYAIIRYNCRINGCSRTSHAPIAQDEWFREMRWILIVNFLFRKNIEKFIFTSIILSMWRAGKLWAANGIITSINNTYGIFVVLHLRPSDRRHIQPSRVWCVRVQSTNHSLTRETDTQ